MCELQCHGSIAVIKTLSSALASIDGLRFAEPGEFARRAFYNRKLDLSDAESLADLIDAETEVQLDQAIKGAQETHLDKSVHLGDGGWSSDVTSSCLTHSFIDFGRQEASSPGYAMDGWLK